MAPRKLAKQVPAVMPRIKGLSEIEALSSMMKIRNPGTQTIHYDSMIDPTFFRICFDDF